MSVQVISAVAVAATAASACAVRSSWLNRHQGVRSLSMFQWSRTYGAQHSGGAAFQDWYYSSVVAVAR